MSAPAAGMSPPQFIAKWTPVTLPERAASQEHFIDLCRMLGQPTPAEHDATGAEYTFEKTVAVTGPASARSKGDRGFADVWWVDKFGWEYKTKDKHKALDDAYRQLCQYREALGNPPLLVVCDIARIEIHTNFTGTAKQVHRIALEDLADPDNIALLRRVFTDPYSFKPKLTIERITEEIAEQFGKAAIGLRDRGHDPHDTAHFLMKCMFCLFAEDVQLLPEELFSKLLLNWKDDPAGLTQQLNDLFTAMKDGGAFGVDRIDYFNGGLFDGAPALDLNSSEIGTLVIAAGRDWSQVEPAIFGTLFERSLDPTKRSQIGAHYTSREDIMLVVEPVVMAPLRREWDAVREQVDKQLQRRRKAQTAATKRKADEAIRKALQGFMERLASIHILDPACGSGNFLYVAIQQLLDLEKRVITFAAQPEIGVGLIPNVRPTQLLGIEINPYAAELAQVVIWIGYLQWMRENGFVIPRDPILEPLQTIECRDAILSFPAFPQPPAPPGDRPENPPAEPGATGIGVVPAPWPDAEFIIGNPPFLGSKLFREYGLEENYIRAMYDAYELPNTSDLCCYWFERARQVIERSQHEGSPRVGLLATQGIRGGDNRKALERIKNTGDIFCAWSDREWVLDGAAVHVSIIGFDGGAEHERMLDGEPAERITSRLRGDIDLTVSVTLLENDSVYRRSPEKGGKFDLKHDEARLALTMPNPNGCPNSDIIKPWINGETLIKRRGQLWIIDFPSELGESDAAQYEWPYRTAKERVKPDRAKNRYAELRERWWVFRRSGEGVRQYCKSAKRMLCTTMTAKHRIFRWVSTQIQPDKGIPVFARDDDYFFGVLHGSVHELWARRMGTQLREVESGFRYTPTTCFETFALPWPPGREPIDSRGREAAGGPRASARGYAAQHEAYLRIGEAAHELNELRENWLNPPQWIDPIAKTVDAMEDFSDVPDAARALIRASAIQALAAKDPRLKKRTLTNLYNERPTWLKLAHEKLDRAVLAAYTAVDPEGGWDEDWAEVWVDHGAGQPLPGDHPLTERRAEVDQRVLANLLRLNQQRSGAGDAG